MTRLFLILLLSVLISLQTSATEINPEAARHLAQSFLNRQARAKGNAARIRKATTTELTLAYTDKSTTDASIANFYVFNRAWNGGYVIVSANEDCPDMILGYTEQGQFDYNRLPDNLRWWLSQYSAQIEDLRTSAETKAEAHRLSAARRLNGATVEEAGTVVVEPLLGDNNWDQSKPFNKFCPVLDGQRTLVGCMALSMAQVMSYFRWPLQGQSSHSYEWNGQTISADFSKSVYAWDKIKPQYSRFETGESVDAVAKLVSDVGIAIDMDYGTDGSASTLSAATKAMQTYFGYSTALTVVNLDDDMSRKRLDNWVAKIKKELDNLSPVLYTGRGPQGGHAFVCDGYTSNSYLHFNWGWGGNYNGYYKIMYLNPSKDEYNRTNSIIINMSKPYTKVVLVDGLYYNQLNTTSMELTYVPAGKEYYAGSVTIPATINYEGKEYNVTSINNLAFYRCTDVTDIYVPWTTPPMVNSNAFDATNYTKATLHVPAGTTENYAVEVPWGDFSRITDTSGGVSIWTGWHAFDTGIGTFTLNLETTEQVKAKVSQRQLISNPAVCQLRISNMATYPDFVIDYDAKTHQCVIPKFFVGMSNNTDSIFISDLKVYADDMAVKKNNYSYANYPNYYDPEAGQLTLHLVQYTKAKEIRKNIIHFKFDTYPDFSISMQEAKKAELSNGSCDQTFAITKGEGVKYYQYILVDSLVTSYYKYEQMMREIVAGTLLGKRSEGEELTITLPKDGSYTLIVASFGENDVFKHLDFWTTDYTSYLHWKTLGMCKFTDGAIAPLFQSDTQTYNVEIQQKEGVTGFYRLKNPYGEKWMFPGTVTSTYATEDTYLEIHAENPEAVYIMKQKIGRIVDGSELYLLSLGAYRMSNGEDINDLQHESGVMGKRKNMEITFPVRSLFVGLDETSYYYTNIEGKFKIDLSNVSSAIEGISIETNHIGHAVYNLQGQRLQQLQRGLNIVDGKKIWVR